MKKDNELYQVWQVNFELYCGDCDSWKFETREQAEKEARYIKALDPKAKIFIEEITVCSLDDVWNG